MSALRRSWDDDGCHDGDSCWWVRPTTSSNGTRRSRGRSHLLVRHLLFRFSGPDRTTVTSIGLGRDHRLGNELSAVALVDSCLVIGIDLSLLVVVDSRSCLHPIIRGVVCERELAVELKLRRGILPLLPVVVEHALALIVDNIDALQSVKYGCHSLLCGVNCIGTLVELPSGHGVPHGDTLVQPATHRLHRS